MVPHARSPHEGFQGSPAWGLGERSGGASTSGRGAETAATAATNGIESNKYMAKTPLLLARRPRQQIARAEHAAAHAEGRAAATGWDGYGTPAMKPVVDTASTAHHNAPAGSAVADSASIAPSRLTHLTPTGEAHMVDVGAKPWTRRVAVAVAAVRFSNAEPKRLIAENSNKKGDVLGVARIAGIMAAKGTSGLIPLCHPIAISKVAVDLELLDKQSVAYGPGGRIHGTETGTVYIIAQVETVGPTGVEMEALTAATGAALTVYDMCKAVDKRMEVRDVGVVYKSGGRSGVFMTTAWARRMGEEAMAGRGLEWDARVPRPPKRARD